MLTTLEFLNKVSFLLSLDTEPGLTRKQKVRLFCVYEVNFLKEWLIYQGPHIVPQHPDQEEDGYYRDTWDDCMIALIANEKTAKAVLNLEQKAFAVCSFKIKRLDPLAFEITEHSSGGETKLNYAFFELELNKFYKLTVTEVED